MKAEKTLPAKNQEKLRRSLDLQEMEEAERSIIRIVQRDQFPAELREISKNEMYLDDGGSEISKHKHDNCKQKRPKQKKMINKSSAPASLDPEIQGGLLVVGGGLRNARIPQNAKHQMILPKDHHVSTLLIRDIHGKVKH